MGHNPKGLRNNVVAWKRFKRGTIGKGLSRSDRSARIVPSQEVKKVLASNSINRSANKGILEKLFREENCQQVVDCQRCFSLVTRLSCRSANKPSFSRTSRTIQPSSYTRLCPCQRRRKPPPSCNRYSPHVHRAAAQLCRENGLFGLPCRVRITNCHWLAV
jgi:hypothetical protein